MSDTVLSIDKDKYNTHEISSFIYEPVFSANGSVKDFRILYASDIFAADWKRIYNNDDYIGALLKESTLMDEYTLEMMKRFVTEEPYAFVSYLPMVDMHLFFEPIPGLPSPYAGFYITNITGYSSKEAKSHFLSNIAQMKNNAVLLRQREGDRFDAVFISDDFANMMECTVARAMQIMSGIGFYKTTHPEDRPLVRSMLKHRVAYDGTTSLTLCKITDKGNHIWCNVHYSFIDDFNEHYIYCTYTDVSAIKEYEDRLKSIYASTADRFYNNIDRTFATFRVNLTKDKIEEVRGCSLYPTDSVAYTFTESMANRAAYYPIESERSQFTKTMDRDSLIDNYNSGTPGGRLVLYSLREDGMAHFVSLTIDITREPITGDVVAFIVEEECNADKVSHVLTNKILEQQFDMVAYIANGKYGVTIGDEKNIKYASIFPTTREGSYERYLRDQVMPVLAGDDETKDDIIKSLSIDTIEREIARSEPYVVNIEIKQDGESYFKRFDFYSVEAGAKFYILLKSDTTEIMKEQIEYNNKLSEALEAANAANVAKTAFLSSMSHEIRTPMNAIIGLDNIALNEPGLSDRTREHLEKIGGSAHHLLGLINDILDMSRIESGRMTLRNEEFSFSNMLEQINTMINSQCQDKGLTYECRVNGKILNYYIGDDMKLKQVIINILGNAVKFTPEGGTVSLIVEAVASYSGQSTIRFIMKDTGIGMDKEYIPKIFDAFSQENSSHTTKYGSTGLGMSITKNIVEMMNGNIEVESEKGVGSTFTVDVTLRDSKRQDKDDSDISPHELNVLVIDDDPVALEHATIVLEELGITADTARDGTEAIKMVKLKSARGEAYNLIFVDWKMPDKDGIEVTRELRDIIGHESAVIVLTAYSWDDIEEEAKTAGVDSFMAKPLFSANVLSCYQKAMENKASIDSEEHLADLTGRKILIAEDMEINAEILMEILRMQDMEPEHAENGQIALDMFTDHESGYYDAILMDMKMPVMDGLSATKAIRATDKPDAKTIPIIALTANAFDEDVQRSLQSGMNAHLTKPIEPDLLISTLATLIKD